MSCHVAVVMFLYLFFGLIYHTVNRLRSFLSSCHPVLWSFGHYLIIWSFGHLVTRSLGHLVTWSLGHLVTWSLFLYFQHCDWLTLGLTGMLRSYMSHKVTLHVEATTTGLVTGESLVVEDGRTVDSLDSSSAMLDMRKLWHVKMWRQSYFKK